jgi:hypothetical protein
MYCPECLAEYRQGFNLCADCRIPLVEGPLPADDQENPEQGNYLRILIETTHPVSLDAMVLRLEEERVPYIVQSGTALSILEGFTNEMLPEDWKAVVLVPGSFLEQARRIAAEVKNQPPQPAMEESEE